MTSIFGTEGLVTPPPEGDGRKKKESKYTSLRGIFSDPPEVRRDDEDGRGSTLVGEVLSETYHEVVRPAAKQALKDQLATAFEEMTTPGVVLDTREMRQKRKTLPAPQSEAEEEGGPRSLPDGSGSQAEESVNEAPRRSNRGSGAAATAGRIIGGVASAMWGFAQIAGDKGVEEARNVARIFRERREAKKAREAEERRSGFTVIDGEFRKV